MDRPDAGSLGAPIAFARLFTAEEGVQPSQHEHGPLATVTTSSSSSSSSNQSPAIPNKHIVPRTSPDRLSDLCGQAHKPMEASDSPQDNEHPPAAGRRVSSHPASTAHHDTPLPRADPLTPSTPSTPSIKTEAIVGGPATLSAVIRIPNVELSSTSGLSSPGPTDAPMIDERSRKRSAYDSTPVDAWLPRKQRKIGSAELAARSHTTTSVGNKQDLTGEGSPRDALLGATPLAQEHIHSPSTLTVPEPHPPLGVPHFVMANARRRYDCYEDDDGTLKVAYGALIPDGYKKDLVRPRTPWKCPVRLWPSHCCNLFFSSLSELGAHFVAVHREYLLRDDGDGYFTRIGLHTANLAGAVPLVVSRQHPPSEPSEASAPTHLLTAPSVGAAPSSDAPCNSDIIWHYFIPIFCMCSSKQGAARQQQGLDLIDSILADPKASAFANSPKKRNMVPRRETKLKLETFVQVKAFLIQVTGTLAVEQGCLACLRREGPFVGCILEPSLGGDESLSWDGSCANCVYSGTQCSLLGSQVETSASDISGRARTTDSLLRHSSNDAVDPMPHRRHSLPVPRPPLSPENAAQRPHHNHPFPVSAAATGHVQLPLSQSPPPPPPSSMHVEQRPHHRHPFSVSAAAATHVRPFSKSPTKNVDFCSSFPKSPLTDLLRSATKPFSGRYKGSNLAPRTVEPNSTDHIPSPIGPHRPPDFGDFGAQGPRLPPSSARGHLEVVAPPRAPGAPPGSNSRTVTDNAVRPTPSLDKAELQHGSESLHSWPTAAAPSPIPASYPGTRSPTAANTVPQSIGRASANQVSGVVYTRPPQKARSIGPAPYHSPEDTRPSRARRMHIPPLFGSMFPDTNYMPPKPPSPPASLPGAVSNRGSGSGAPEVRSKMTQTPKAQAPSGPSSTRQLGLVSSDTADVCKRESWELAPGRLRSVASKNHDNIAFSCAYLGGAAPARVCEEASFHVRSVGAGRAIAFGASENTVRLCAVAFGKVRVQMAGEPVFRVGIMGLFKIRPGVACTVTNDTGTDAMLQITSIERDPW